ncbi:MAG TPA: transketolase C-terminal domain-containing protein [Kiritimatiellia bacterium]|nr:transketolase C-terminal domain-containing protein [Kiritimatiellia bacterium]HRZ11679.1 transketolase C-terminal domain-containing protein [Kiritimatiellia bacterium]HSA16770.1 transketolase C-terminal domain-containing protein [Kiritimatiellia bacterium]
MNNVSQRDAFWTRLYEVARQDRRVIAVAADMGAPALDQFRRDLPGQFVNAGIAEQNGLLVAAGLALEGKHPFLYAIAPFATFRVLELIRVENSIMDIPVTIVGVGAGFGYEDSGPTHHILEDIAALRAFPHVTIHSVSDSTMAAAVAEHSCGMKHANYVRLDRAVLPELYQAAPDLAKGFAVLRPSKAGWLIGTGYMTHKALRLANRLAGEGLDLGVMDLFAMPFDEKAFVAALGKAPRLFTLEEHFLAGGMGSLVLETLNRHGLAIPVKRFGLEMDKGYSYVYGGRDRILAGYELSEDDLAKAIRNWK